MANCNRTIIHWTLTLNTIILLAFILLDISSKSNVLYPYLLILDSLVLVCLYRDNKGLFFMTSFIAYVNYSVAMGVYLHPELSPELFDQIQNVAVYNEGIMSTIIFTCMLMFPCLSKNYKYVSINNDVIANTNYSKIVEGICVVVYLILLFTQTEWEVGTRMASTALGEYKFLFAIIGSLYSPKNRFHSLLWTLILSVSALVSFIGGNRVDAFPMIFIMLLIWYPNLSNKQLLLSAIPAIVMLQLIGVIRGNLSILTDFDTKILFNDFFKTRFVQDTFTYAYFPSLSAIDLSYVDDISTKCDLFLKNIIYIFAGGSYGEYSLANYTYNYYIHCFGFIGSTYLNYWFGILGPILAGVVVNIFIKRIKISDVSNAPITLKNAFGLCFICITPRWYVYNFMFIFRAFLIFSILYFVFSMLNRRFSHRT